MFYYEKWDVFKAALELRELADKLKKYTPPDLMTDLRHFREAASSVINNLGEGARHEERGRRVHHYRIALGSSSECNCSLIILSRGITRGPGKKLTAEGKHLCNRIAPMMTNLIRSAGG